MNHSSVSATPMLISFIRTERTKNQIKAYKLSESIGRSISYISQFEKGNISRIDFDALVSIFKALSRGVHNDFDSYLLSLVMNHIKTKYYEELIKEEWLLTLCANLYEYEINEQIVREINSKTEALSIKKEIFNNSVSENMPFNKSSYSVINLSANGEREYSLNAQINYDTLLGIINGKISKANYITLLSINYVFYLLENFDKYSAIRKSEEKLNSLGITILSEIKKEPNKASPTDEIFQFFDAINDVGTRSFEDDSKELLDNMRSMLIHFNNTNAHYTMTQMEFMHNNITKYPSLVFALLSFPFFEINNLSPNNQTELLKDILGLLRKYRE